MRDLYKPTFIAREEAARHAPKGGIRHMTTGAGESVFTQNNVVERLKAGRDMIALVQEAVSLINQPISHGGRRDRVMHTIDLGRIIGVDECVSAPKITLDQQAYFALIPRHHEPVRVVTDLDPIPCSTITLVLEATSSGFQLVAAWIGRVTPRQPHDIRFKKPFEEARTELEFWCSHALVAKPEWGRPWRSSWRQVITEAISGD